LPLSSFLYISRSTIDPGQADAMVEQIVAAAVIANSKRRLTGTLLFTGTHFAQIVEGSAAHLQTLLAALRDDDRHTDLQLIHLEPLCRRQFSNWGLAYHGPSAFVSHHAARVLHDSKVGQHSRSADLLIELMHEFAKP